MQVEQNEFLAALPNLPGDEVPAGGKENNQVVAVYGEKPTFDFEPKHHVDLVTELGLIDYPAEPNWADQAFGFIAATAPGWNGRC